MEKINKINIINIFLMLLSFCFAFIFPFELFLIVYAVLGPLHYLTEINWLHKKNYFTTQKKDYYVHILILCLISIALFSPLSFYLRKYLAPFIFIAFCSSFAMVYFKEVISKIIFNSGTIIISFLLFYLFESKFTIIFSMFLPTLIHVFIFTGIFILVGTLKDKSRSGKISLIFFIICAVVLLFIPINYNFSVITDQIQNNYHSFEKLNQKIITILSQLTTSNDVYFSNIGIQVMRFIAFAYTYHYFNWFSKTSIIQWHDTSKFKLIIIVLIWITSIVLYFYDYNTGLKWLYILSMAHVILEFPLNFISILNLKTIIRNNC